MNRRLFLFAVPALSFLKPRSLAQRLGDSLKTYQRWLDSKHPPQRPPTKSTWDAMCQGERNTLGLPSFNEWKASAERWHVFMRRVHKDRVNFVKKVNL